MPDTTFTSKLPCSHCQSGPDLTWKWPRCQSLRIWRKALALSTARLTWSHTDDLESWIKQLVRSWFHNWCSIHPFWWCKLCPSTVSPSVVFVKHKLCATQVTLSMLCLNLETFLLCTQVRKRLAFPLSPFPCFVHLFGHKKRFSSSLFISSWKVSSFGGSGLNLRPSSHPPYVNCKENVGETKSLHQHLPMFLLGQYTPED